ncbi:unnamed protein product [Ixodes pacificus]
MHLHPRGTPNVSAVVANSKMILSPCKLCKHDYQQALPVPQFE